MQTKISQMEWDTNIANTNASKIKHRIVKKHWEHVEPHCTRASWLSKQNWARAFSDENENLSLSEQKNAIFHQFTIRSHRQLTTSSRLCECARSFSRPIFITSFRQITVFVAVSFLMCDTSKWAVSSNVCLTIILLTPEIRSQLSSK